MKGLIVLAHGSKVKETNDTLVKIIDSVREKVKYDRVEGAYLQLMDPMLDKAVETLYSEGIRNITVFPMFLFKGNHIREDIPAEIDKILEGYEDLNITFLENIGYDEKLVEIITERVDI